MYDIQKRVLLVPKGDKLLVNGQGEEGEEACISKTVRLVK